MVLADSECRRSKSRGCRRAGGGARAGAGVRVGPGLSDRSWSIRVGGVSPGQCGLSVRRAGAALSESAARVVPARADHAAGTRKGHGQAAVRGEPRPRSGVRGRVGVQHGPGRPDAGRHPDRARAREISVRAVAEAGLAGFRESGLRPLCPHSSETRIGVASLHYRASRAAVKALRLVSQGPGFEPRRAFPKKHDTCFLMVVE